MTEADPSPAKGTGRRNPSSLRLRILSAVVFIPMFVLVNHLGGPWYLGFVIGVLSVGIEEFENILKARLPGYRTRGAAYFGVVLLALIFYDPSALGPAIALFVMVLLIVEVFRGHPDGAIVNVIGTGFAVLYVAGLGVHLGFLRDLSEGAVLFTFIVTWSGDSGAYFVGRAFGRHKLFPAVSPKKSVEGAVGGIVASLVAAAISSPSILPEATMTHALILGALAGIVGPIGDLCESMLKRDSGVKDSATYIPGHGGVLDRFDSLLFVAPVFYYYLKYLVFQE